MLAVASADAREAVEGRRPATGGDSHESRAGRKLMLTCDWKPTNRPAAWRESGLTLTTVK
jgi:hypothetical protein